MTGRAALTETGIHRQQFVFVGGLHRSGTSLLAGLLARHPDASGLSRTRISENEGQFLQHAYPRDSELGGAGRFAFDARAEHPPCDPREAAALREAILHGWRTHWDTSKRFLIEKTPGNCLNAGFLQSVFAPDCAFVFVTRHPVANAFATRKWSRTSLFALTEHWLHAHELMQRQAVGLRRVAWVSYENLIADPDGTLAGLHAFLGMGAAPLGLGRLRDHNAAYFATWRSTYQRRIGGLPESIIRGEVQDPSLPRRAVWWLRARLRRALLNAGMDIVSTGREAGAIVKYYEGRVQQFGYSLVDLDRVPAPAAPRGPGVLTSFAVAGRGVRAEAAEERAEPVVRQAVVEKLPATWGAD
jgi:hypothetical protein